MAEASKKFTVVKFKQIPIESMKDTECVPTSWIKNSLGEDVVVKFPTEMTPTNKSLMRNGKDPLNKWDVYRATIVCQLDTYKEWDSITSPPPAGRGKEKSPKTPLVEQLENLVITTPSTSKEPRKPKNLQKTINTPDTAGVSPNTIQVDEELLQDLYRTWEHMNSLMERIFKPENRPNQQE